ncbi:MAG: hypothetical protein DMH00_10625 [Acidobacteria bacterium]|nr:MAG: hypothetical protein DMH00_10625 [Acidobacteriota bacterium]
MSRIPVLQFATEFRIGGTERHIVDLLRGLDASRFALQLACLRRSGELLDEIDSLGVPVEEYRIRGLFGLGTLRDQGRLVRQLRDHRIQLVHTYGFYPNVFALPAAYLASTPARVASVRDLGDLWTSRQRRVQKLACRLAHRVVVNAEAVRQRLISDGYPRERIRVIKNGIDLARFDANRRTGGLRRELGLGAGVPLVGVLSRLNPKKGVGVFVEAAAQLAAAFPEAVFLVVGDGGSRRELEGLTGRLGLGSRVRFTGFRRDVPAILSEMAVCVLPSPVVATRVGGNEEVVAHGITGLLVPPGKAEPLANALRALLENPGRASEFGRAGRQRVRELFSFERMIRETESLYDELLEEVAHRKAFGRPVVRVEGSWS